MKPTSFEFTIAKIRDIDDKPTVIWIWHDTKTHRWTIRGDVYGSDWRLETTTAKAEEIILFLQCLTSQEGTEA